MIPIGAPISAVSITTGRTVYGTLIENYTKELSTCSEVGEDKTGYGILVFTSSLKIMYDNPAPFTLWQLNALAQEDANDDWFHEPQQLAPNHICRYWMHSTFTIIPIKPISVN